MSGDVTICVTCKKEEKDPKKVIECAQCYKNEHFKCRNVFGNAVRKLRETPFFCSIQCQEFHQKANKATSDQSKVLNELRTVLTEVRETRAEVHEMKTTVTDMEKFQNFLSGQLDSLLNEVKSLKTEQSILKADAEQMRKEHLRLNTVVSQLELEVDRTNRAALAKNAMILGVPLKRDEDARKIVQNIAAAIGYELPDGAIVQAKRVISNESKQQKTESVPIKITFSNDLYKEDLFNKKRAYGPLLPNAIDPAYGNSSRKVVVRDELTPHGMKLLKRVREIQDELNLKFVWAGRNGAILAKTSENSKTEVIRSTIDVEALRKSGRKRQLDLSGCSPSSGPVPKRS